MARQRAAHRARHQRLAGRLAESRQHIPDGYLDDYVSLHWLEWNAGSLRVTVVGENICRQLTAGLSGAADL